MFDTLSLLRNSGFSPFLIATYILFGFLMIEIVMAMMGLTSDVDSSGPDVDMDSDFETDLILDIETALAVNDGVTEVTSSPPGSVWSFLDLGKVPLTVWIASMAGGFAATGFFLQGISLGLLGFILPWYAATALAVPVGFVIGKMLIDGFAFIFPKTTSESVPLKSLGGAVGRITLGVATADLPARAEVRDRYGYPHLVRVIPYQGEPDLQQGDEIMTLRGPGPVYYAMTLQSATTRLTEGHN